jgi:hypothetical protein
VVSKHELICTPDKNRPRPKNADLKMNKNADPKIKQFKRTLK